MQMMVACFRGPKGESSLGVWFTKLMFAGYNGRVVTGVQTPAVKKLKMFLISITWRLHISSRRNSVQRTGKL